jgi:glycoside/pentoside/hexuronide:cation symporter, GPH family
MMAVSDRDKIAGGTLFYYALPQIPHSLALMPVVNFVPAFYADTLGLPLAMVGLMLFLTRITDIFTDPVIGIWSDKTRTRIGRRKPFILAGLPMLCAASWFVFVPAEGAGLLWLFIGLFFMYLGFTLVDLPYASWGAELSNDYDERSRISAWRGGFGAIGTLVTLSIPLILQLIGRPGAGEALFWMAVFFIIAQPLAFAVMMRKVAEPPPGDLSNLRVSFSQGARAVMTNRPFVRLLMASGLMLAGMVVGATLNLLVLTHVIGAPEAFPTVIFLQNIVMLLGIPVWARVASRYGKHISMSLCALWVAAALSLSFIWTRGDVVGFSATIILLGFGIGGLLFLGQALTADVIDKDLLETGQERTATYYAVLGMGTKAAIAVGVLVGTAIPALIGFQPSDPVHAPETLLGLRAVYAFAGTPFILIAAYLLWHYPLTRAVQSDLQSAIAQRRGAGI